MTNKVYPINRTLSFSCFYKIHKLFNIIKIIIITHYTVTMIDNSVCLISFKTIQ